MKEVPGFKEAALLYESLCEELKGHPGKYSHTGMFCQSAAAWYCLDLMMKERNLQPVIKEDAGKPYLEKSPFYISISHDRQMAGAMISDRPCGLDLQGIRDISSKTKNRCHMPANPYEKQLIEKEHGDVILWSAREAVYKADPSAFESFEDVQVHPQDIHWQIQDQLVICWAVL